MFKGLIYLITNKVNGKKYVGQTTQPNIKYRFYQHIYIANKNPSRSVISYAIKKYGKGNFEITLLEDRADSLIELNLLEEAYIQVLNTMAPYGYNLKSRADGKGSTHPDTKLKMRQAKRKGMTGEHLQKLKENGIRRKESGWKMSLNSRMKLSKAKTGVPHKCLYKQVCAYDNISGEMYSFKCIKDAAEYFGVAISTISMNLKNKSKLVSKRLVFTYGE